MCFGGGSSEPAPATEVIHKYPEPEQTYAASASAPAAPVNAAVEGSQKTPGETGTTKMFDRGQGVYANVARFGEKYRANMTDKSRAMFGGYGASGKLGSTA